MAIDERARIELREHLVEVLGPEPADALMAQLPAVEWQDLATRSDLASLEARVDARFELFEQRSDARFELFEERSDARFELFEQNVDARFELFEQKVDARFELSEQRSEARFAQFDLALTNTKNEVIGAFRGELLAAVSNQTRMFLLAVVGAVVSSGGLVLSATQLS